MKKSLKTTIVAVVIATGYAMVTRFVFGISAWNNLLEVMSISFLFLVPAIVGFVSVYYSTEEKTKSIWYRLLFPWIPIFIFFCLTLLLSIEGWACWLMVLPMFLLASSVGGMIGGYLKSRKNTNKFQISLIALLPVLLSPLEAFVGSIPGKYEAYTFIDINAPSKVIWSEVTRVREISVDQDKGWLTRFLGFPRPVKAELNYEGVGAYREARFTGGLVFHETVTSYQHEKNMEFTIKAYPHEIPSTTMDEHVVIGGKYFDVLNGTYRLEKINAHTHRLHLTSRFKISTTFNFYAGWWAGLIMKDIQNNILQVEKRRAEMAAKL